MSEKFVFSDYYHPSDKEVCLIDEWKNEQDPDKQNELLKKIIGIRGIYTDEEGILRVREAAFVKYIIQSFSVLSIAGS
jgi:hypothetical protein